MRLNSCAPPRTSKTPRRSTFRWKTGFTPCARCSATCFSSSASPPRRCRRTRPRCTSRKTGCTASTAQPKRRRRPATGARRARISRSSPRSPRTRTPIEPSCARRKRSCLRSAERSVRRVAAGAFAALVFASVFVAVSGSKADPGEEDPRTSSAGSDYAAGKKAVEAKDWKSAVERLNKALLQDDRNPDIQNLLGYAYRNAGQLDSAFKHYQRALELNPRHRGAREYLGEAYLLANDVQKAQEQLAALRQICLIPCEEYEDLEKAITAYSKRAARFR